MSWLRKVAVVCLVTFVATGILGALTAQAQDKGIAAIKKNGKLMVGTASGYYPFEMVDKKNELMGFDVAIAKAIAQEMGVQVEFQNDAFSGLIPALQSSKIDLVIAGMTVTDKRKEVVDFSDTYLLGVLPAARLLVERNDSVLIASGTLLAARLARCHLPWISYVLPHGRSTDTGCIHSDLYCILSREGVQ